MKKTLLIIAIALSAISSVNAAGLTSEATSKNSQAACQLAWSQSSAKETCNATITYMGGDMCNAGASCQYYENGYLKWRNTAISTHLIDFNRVTNCNGYLKSGGSC